MMIVVTLETILGITCPLTYLENILRGITQSEFSLVLDPAINLLGFANIYFYLVLYFVGMDIIYVAIFHKDLAGECIGKKYKGVELNPSVVIPLSLTHQNPLKSFL